MPNIRYRRDLKVKGCEQNVALRHLLELADLEAFLMSVRRSRAVLNSNETPSHGLARISSFAFFSTRTLYASNRPLFDPHACDPLIWKSFFSVQNT
jgi:hypothetical protein